MTDVHHYHGSSFAAGFGGCLGVMAAMICICIILPIGCTVMLAALAPEPVHERYESRVVALPIEPAEPPESIEPLDTDPDDIDVGFTLVDFREIENGMHYDEVMSRLGNGSVLHSTDLSTIYEWKNVDGSYIMVSFSRGKGEVISRSQFGLK